MFFFFQFKCRNEHEEILRNPSRMSFGHEERLSSSGSLRRLYFAENFFSRSCICFKFYSTHFPPNCDFNWSISSALGFVYISDFVVHYNSFLKFFQTPKYAIECTIEWCVFSSKGERTKCKTPCEIVRVNYSLSLKGEIKIDFFYADSKIVEII